MESTQYDTLWSQAWADASTQGPGFLSRHACILRLLSNYNVHGRLLEVGAGRGDLLVRIQQRFPQLQLTALEPGTAAAQALRARPGLSAVHHGPLGEPSARPEGFFDVIVCSEVLEHIEDDERALVELIDLAAPGGLLFLTVPMRADLWTPVDDAVGHVRRYEPGQLASLCQAYGLQVLHDQAHGFPLYNTYYRLLGRRTPEETAKLGRKSLLARVAARVAAAAFLLETRVDSRRGARGFVVARKPQGDVGSEASSVFR